MIYDPYVSTYSVILKVLESRPVFVCVARDGVVCVCVTSEKEFQPKVTS